MLCGRFGEVVSAVNVLQVFCSPLVREQLVATCKHLYDKIADTQIAFFLTALVGFIGQAHVRNCV